MRILFCGTLVPPEYENRIRDLSNAANRFQLNLIHAMQEYAEMDVHSYLGMVVDNAVREKLQQVNKLAKIHIKSKNCLAAVMRYKRDVKQALKEADVLMTYNVTYAWMFAPRLAKHMRKKSVLILADYSGENSYQNLLRKVYAKLMLRRIQAYDVVIGLSETTKHFLKQGQQFICVEGGIAQSVYDYFEPSSEDMVNNHDETIYMYAGILEPVTGVDMLLNAFSRNWNPSLRLKISGKGSLEKMVLDAAKKDCRVSYLGCVPYEQYLSNLKSADVLINPRNMNLPENVNNFPSKIMEYLATGKPIISTRFSGWERYQEYISFCDSTAEGLQEALEQNSERKCSAGQQRAFAERFLWKNQARRIGEVCGVDIQQ